MKGLKGAMDETLARGNEGLEWAMDETQAENEGGSRGQWMKHKEVMKEARGGNGRDTCKGE